MAQDVGKENGYLQGKKQNMTNMKVSMKKIEKMVLEFTDGLMVRNTKVSSKMI